MKKATTQHITKGEVRIIAGLWRGRKLPVLPSQGLRPTGDRVKETLFNWLMPYIVDSECLDCFAGSGSLGFEALSRQATKVTFLELEKAVAQQLSKNIQTLKCADRAQVVNQNSLHFLNQPQNQPHFDFLLSDIRGGSIRNAIPREAFATLNFNGDVAQLKSAVENFAVLLKAELALIEPNLTFDLQPTEKSDRTFTTASTQRVIHFLNVLPNGVIRNSDVLENIVETSLSIGVLKTEENQIKATILVRSLIDSGKEYVAEMLTSLASLSGVVPNSPALIRAGSHKHIHQLLI